MNLDDPSWDATTFTKNRDRLVQHEVARQFFEAVVRQAKQAQIISAEHFTVDGTLIEAWASLKSFRKKGRSRRTGGRLTIPAIQRWTFTARSGATRRTSRRPTRKRSSRARAPARSPSSATPGTSSWRTATVCASTFGSPLPPATPSATRRWRCCGDFDAAASTPHSRRRQGVLPRRLPTKSRRFGHPAAPGDPGQCPGKIAGATLLSSAAYRVSQVIRKRVEEIFGWAKTVGGFRKTRVKGREKTWSAGYWVMAAYNLSRMARLLRPTSA